MEKIIQNKSISELTHAELYQYEKIILEFMKNIVFNIYLNPRSNIINSFKFKKWKITANNSCFNFGGGQLMNRNKIEIHFFIKTDIRQLTYEERKNLINERYHKGLSVPIDDPLINISIRPCGNRSLDYNLNIPFVIGYLCKSYDIKNENEINNFIHSLSKFLLSII